MKTVTSRSGQSIWDIALQEYGGVEAVDWISEDNNIGLCDNIEAGTILKLRDEVIDVQLVNYYMARNILPNSAITEDSTPTLQGIGYWAIEGGFKIS